MNRRIFFDGIRESIFGGSLNQRQVEGIDGILDAWDDGDWTDLRWLACILGQCWLEVGSDMYPVREGFAASDQEAIAHVSRLHAAGKIKTNYALPDPDTGLAAFGRGLIQLTWIENYIRAGQELGIDLVDNPDLLLEPAVSGKVAVRGCIEGWFRGDKSGRYNCARYFTASKNEWAAARNIVNGDKRGGDLEYRSKLFFHALNKAAQHAPDPVEKPKEGTNIMGFFNNLFGGKGLIRGLVVGLLAVVGIETGMGGELPVVGASGMSFSDMILPILIWFLSERLGIDIPTADGEKKKKG